MIFKLALFILPCSKNYFFLFEQEIQVYLFIATSFLSIRNFPWYWISFYLYLDCVRQNTFVLQSIFIIIYLNFKNTSHCLIYIKYKFYCKCICVIYILFLSSKSFIVNALVLNLFLLVFKLCSFKFFFSSI